MRLVNGHIARAKLAVIGWLTFVAVGFSCLNMYASKPAVSIATPGRADHLNCLPERDKIDTGLYLFLHPCCVCSMATVRELQRLMPTLNRPVSVHILVAAYPDVAVDTELVHQAQLIPHCTIHLDNSAKLARAVGISASGHILVTRRTGELLFSGGVTQSRGHEGWNSNLSSLKKAIQTGESATGQSDVFGCQLYSTPKGHGQ